MRNLHSLAGRIEGNPATAHLYCLCALASIMPLDACTLWALSAFSRRPMWCELLSALQNACSPTEYESYSHLQHAHVFQDANSRSAHSISTVLRWGGK